MILVYPKEKTEIYEIFDFSAFKKINSAGSVSSGPPESISREQIVYSKAP